MGRYAHKLWMGPVQVKKNKSKGQREKQTKKEAKKKGGGEIREQASTEPRI